MAFDVTSHLGYGQYDYCAWLTVVIEWDKLIIRSDEDFPCVGLTA